MGGSVFNGNIIVLELMEIVVDFVLEVCNIFLNLILLMRCVFVK